MQLQISIFSHTHTHILMSSGFAVILVVVRDGSRVSGL